MAPMGLARAGYYSYRYGYLLYESLCGLYWSPRSYSSTISYYLYFYSGRVYPQDSLDRGAGFLVRCLAR